MYKKAVSLNKVTKAVMNRAYRVKNWDKGIASDIIKGKRFPLRPREAFYAPKDLSKKTVKQIKTLSAGNVPYEKYLREMYKQNLSGGAQLSKAAELVKESKKKCKKKSKVPNKMSKAASIIIKFAEQDKYDPSLGSMLVGGGAAGAGIGAAAGLGVDKSRKAVATHLSKGDRLLKNMVDSKKLHDSNIDKQYKWYKNYLKKGKNKYTKTLGAIGLGVGLGAGLISHAANKERQS